MPSPQNFEAELRGRELVISNLKEAGEVLIGESDNHPNSDKTDILDRQNAALNHWDDLLLKHKKKSSAVSDLEKKLADLSSDVDEVVKQCGRVTISPESLEAAEKTLDKMLKDIASMVLYSNELEERMEIEAAVSCADDFQPLVVSFYVLLLHSANSIVIVGSR